MIAMSLNVGGGVRLIKPAKLCMCTQNTTHTTKKDARRRVCAAMVPYRSATRGKSLRELEYTHISMPVYFEQLSRQTRNSHPLAFCQIQTTANYYKYSFFPLSKAYWNRLPAEVVMLPTLDQFSVAVHLWTTACHSQQHSFFNLFLYSILAILTLSPFNFSLFLFLHLDFKSQSTCT